MLYDVSCIHFLPDASNGRYKKSHKTKLYRVNWLLHVLIIIDCESEKVKMRLGGGGGGGD